MAPRPSDQVRRFVSSRVHRLQSGYLARFPSAIGDLAALRQSGAKDVGEDPRVWALLFEDLPEELQGKGQQASYAERAINDALVLYAVHQQSQSEAVHRDGIRFGTAVGKLALARSQDGTMDESTLRRFQSAALAQTHDGRVTLLRQLVSMMRSQHPVIGLDYGWLAADLFDFQFVARAHQIRLAWGRSLHRRHHNETTHDDQTRKEN